MLLKKCEAVISKNINNINADIRKYCEHGNKDPSKVILIGASKSQSIEKIQEAYLAGLNNFGENYLQEAEEKINKLDDKIIWHFIGALQSRKAKKVAEIFDWVHTVDTYKLAKKLNDSRPESKGPLNVCIQINIDSEDSKSGLSEECLEDFIEDIMNFKNLEVRGLMVIPKPREKLEDQKIVFNKVNLINEALKKKGFKFDTLSMGMSTDYGAAIQEALQ